MKIDTFRLYIDITSKDASPTSHLFCTVVNFELFFFYFWQAVKQVRQQDAYTTNAVDAVKTMWNTLSMATFPSLIVCFYLAY